jgi:pimeloyl-ACP methyl ester carboxylesterase
MWHQASAEEPRLQLDEGTVEVDDATIHYLIGGSGPPLLMIHGFGWGARYWDPFVDAFGEHYTIILPDLRGHGRSTGLQAAWSYKQAARDMFGLLDQLGIERVSAIGYSAGGNTLIHMADQQPDRLSSMVLVAGGHRLTMEVREMLRTYPPFDAFTPEQQQEIRRFHVRGDGQVEELFAQLRGLAENYVDFDFSPEHLATMSTRSLLVWGDRDEFYPLDTALELYEALPNASFWVLPGEGHLFLTPDVFSGSPEARAAFAPTVLRFLRAPASG